jgi:hypothetical protein
MLTRAKRKTQQTLERDQTTSDFCTGGEIYFYDAGEWINGRNRPPKRVTACISIAFEIAWGAPSYDLSPSQVYFEGM